MKKKPVERFAVLRFCKFQPNARLQSDVDSVGMRRLEYRLVEDAPKSDALELEERFSTVASIKATSGCEMTYIATTAWTTGEKARSHTKLQGRVVLTNVLNVSTKCRNFALSS
jgi:hypothetical protein